jgi:hypothetical protein
MGLGNERDWGRDGLTLWIFTQGMKLISCFRADGRHCWHSGETTSLFLLYIVLLSTRLPHIMKIFPLLSHSDNCRLTITCCTILLVETSLSILLFFHFRVTSFLATQMIYKNSMRCIKVSRRTWEKGERTTCLTKFAYIKMRKSSRLCSIRYTVYTTTWLHLVFVYRTWSLILYVSLQGLCVISWMFQTQIMQFWEWRCSYVCQCEYGEWQDTKYLGWLALRFICGRSGMAVSTSEFSW